MIFNRNTAIKSVSGKAVIRAEKSLKRDMGWVFRETKEEGGDIELVQGKMLQECFTLEEKNHKLVLTASDELGFVYGLYEISKRFLGITPFWFWNDQKLQKIKSVCIPSGFFYASEPFAIKFRGWFVNDEVLLHTWKIKGDKDAPWEMVMEALLRLGGNLIIPGTDKNSQRYSSLAYEMGLYVTHHHAEPLGAEMFSRAYPDLTPSYAQYPEKFQQLWQEGIERQKNYKIIWNLGFRGQGDTPFWVHDEKYNTPKSRGELISSIIRQQYEMIKEKQPDAVCCTNLYGETMELYQQGYLDLPEDIIRVWADNGFGKMVSRRQGNHNPRVSSLPHKKDEGKNGIYYHVSFYDLQAANHITMLPNSPEFIYKELENVLQKGMKDYWIINCSNVKPHTYYLDFIAKIWRDGKLNIEKHRNSYLDTYYGKENRELLNKIQENYFKCAIAYGEYEDEHAGEQFSNHIARILVNQFIKSREKYSEELLWATDARTLEAQIHWYQELCEKAARSYEKYMRDCEKADALISEQARTLYQDTFLLQAQIHKCCFSGAVYVCKALVSGLLEDYRKAFYYAGKGAEYYQKANRIMREREHGKWHGFYENECLTDMKQTAWVLRGFMSYVRALGDGPHYYQWQRDFLYAEEDRRVMLIMNMENHLTDQELFALMKEQWEK